MLNPYDKNSPLNPIGEYDPICESQDHSWRIIWLYDMQFRDCSRCGRFERLTNKIWEVNVIKPSIA